VTPVLEAHSLWAGTYDRTPNPLLALEERIVESLLPDLEKLTIVDVACGTGRWLVRTIQGRAGFAVGLDVCSEMLHQAKGKLPLQGRLIQADCEAMPLANGIADLVICSFAVSYIPGLRGFARELSRIVKEGGRVFLSDFHPSAYQRGWKRAFRHNQRTIEIDSFCYSIDDICDAIRNAGFDLLIRLEPCFGEPERHLFEAGGKDLLEHSLAPAIFVCHFTRTRLTGNQC
jgi:ubiquinone/menaquinone biosynthesis C-methylase UbiE